MAKDAKFGIGIQISASDKASAVIGKVAANAKKAALIGSMSTERNRYKLLDEMERRRADSIRLSTKAMQERNAVDQGWASRLSGGAGGILGGLAKGAAWAGGIAAIGTGVVAAFGQRIINTVGELKDFGAQTGFNVEALQAWEFAASQAGVPIEELRGSIEKLSKGFGGLKGNKGPLYEFLKGKGDIAFIKQLKAAKGPEAALDLLIRKMEKIPDESARATLAVAAFGKSGAGMARLAAEGSGALDKMRQRAVALGLVLDADAVGSVEAFGDQIDEAKLAVGAIGRDILVSLVPGLSKATGGLTDWIKKNREMVIGKGVEFLKGMWKTLQSIGSWLTDNKDTFGRLFNTASTAAGFLVDNIGLIKAGIVGLATAWTAGKVISGFQTVSDLATNISKGLSMGAGGTSAIIGAAGALGMAVAVWLDAYDKWTEFAAWKDEQEGLNKRTAQVLSGRVETVNAGRRQLQAETTDVSSPLTEILAGRMVSTAGGAVTVDVRFLDAPVPISVETQKSGNVGVATHTGRRLVGRGR